MQDHRTIKHDFVELIPGSLEPETLYISIKYKTMAHLCLCGCGKKVITPLSPTGWELTFNGREVSVYPSIGNWNLPCRSHYWITRNGIEWAEQWSDVRIAAGFSRDRAAKLNYYRDRDSNPLTTPAEIAKTPDSRRDSVWSRFKKRFS